MSQTVASITSMVKESIDRGNTGNLKEELRQFLSNPNNQDKWELLVSSLVKDLTPVISKRKDLTTDKKDTVVTSLVTFAKNPVVANSANLVLTLTKIGGVDPRVRAILTIVALLVKVVNSDKLEQSKIFG